MVQGMSAVRLRATSAQDQRAFVASARRSRALHAPWVTAPQTAAQFRAYLERMSQPGHHPLLLEALPSAELLGVFNLSHAIMGAFRSAYLGYYAFAGHERQGHMTQGLKLLARHAFTQLGLHRIEANIQPGNLASIALVKAAGFQLEGFSPRYLKINGRWRDHERWALRAD